MNSFTVAFNGSIGTGLGQVFLHGGGLCEAAAERHSRAHLNYGRVQLRDEEGVAAADPNRPVALRRHRPGSPDRDGPGELHHRADPDAPAARGSGEVLPLVLRVHGRAQVPLLPGPAQIGQGA